MILKWFKNFNYKMNRFFVLYDFFFFISSLLSILGWIILIAFSDLMTILGDRIWATGAIVESPFFYISILCLPGTTFLLYKILEYGLILPLLILKKCFKFFNDFNKIVINGKE